MTAWAVPPPHQPELTRDLETIEADARREIARAAAIKVRGFDSGRIKRAALTRVDDLLDEYLEAVWLAADATP